MQKGGKPGLKNMKIDANVTEIRVMGDVVNEDAWYIIQFCKESN